MTLYTDVRNRIETMEDYDCQMFLKAVYLLGVIFPITLTGRAVSGARSKIPYGPTGDDVKLELIDQPKLRPTEVVDLLSRIENEELTIQGTKDNLSRKVEVAIFRIKKTDTERKSPNDTPYRNIALPTQFDGWIKELYNYFKKAGTNYVFPYSRSHYWAVIQKSELFKGLTYIVPDYKRVRHSISGKRTDTETLHVKEMVLTGLHHARFEELQAEYDFDYMDWAAFIEIHFEVERNNSVTVGDWERYIGKLCKKTSFESQKRRTLTDY